MKVIRLRAHVLLLGVLLTVAAVYAVVPRSSAAGAVPLTPAEKVVRADIQSLWEALDQAAATGNSAALPPLFDLQSASGQASLRHAEARLAFVQAWARARGIRWLPPRVTVRTPSIAFRGDARVRVTAIISESWTYAYGPPGTPAPHLNTFGLGREHYMTLRMTPAGWRIAQDWFTDPLDQDTRIPGPALPSAAPAPVIPSPPRPAAVLAARGGYNRAGAVRYANTYCGAAPGCGNNGRYNTRLHDYNGEGGDCTNFVSQALSLGGGLRRNASWTYDGRTGEGTAAWVKAPALLNYLLASGLGRVVARGPYATVAASVGDLSPGDIIGYIEKGDVVHMALVVGFDSRGYTLVDSHTADRYRVPWDIGWDRATQFVLVHVTDGARARPASVPGLFLGVGTGCGPAA